MYFYKYIDCVRVKKKLMLRRPYKRPYKKSYLQRKLKKHLKIKEQKRNYVIPCFIQINFERIRISTK